MKCKRYLISGKVQGVWYRDETQKTANRLDVKGWIKNLNEGGVEVLAQGDEKQLAEFEKWLWQGPEKAKVEKVEVFESDCEGERFEEFRITF